jgi:hypothetical protein
MKMLIGGACIFAVIDRWMDGGCYVVTYRQMGVM